MDIYAIFNKLRYHHEDEVVEFKKAENNSDFDDLGKYFSALSNEANRGYEFLFFYEKRVITALCTVLANKKGNRAFRKPGECGRYKIVEQK
jgi:hypothetical protein